jgi:hypothetical protein
MIGDARRVFTIYPPGVTPEPYVPPWERQREKNENE